MNRELNKPDDEAIMVLDERRVRDQLDGLTA
jgi:hypothetical protein